MKIYSNGLGSVVLIFYNLAVIELCRTHREASAENKHYMQSACIDPRPYLNPNHIERNHRKMSKIQLCTYAR